MFTPTVNKKLPAHDGGINTCRESLEVEEMVWWGPKMWSIQASVHLGKREPSFHPLSGNNWMLLSHLKLMREIMWSGCWPAQLLDSNPSIYFNISYLFYLEHKSSPPQQLSIWWNKHGVNVTSRNKWKGINTRMYVVRVSANWVEIVGNRE